LQNFAQGHLTAFLRGEALLQQAEDRRFFGLQLAQTMFPFIFGSFFEGLDERTVQV